MGGVGSEGSSERGGSGGLDLVSWQRWLCPSLCRDCRARLAVQEEQREQGEQEEEEEEEEEERMWWAPTQLLALGSRGEDESTWRDALRLTAREGEERCEAGGGWQRSSGTRGHRRRAGDGIAADTSPSHSMGEVIVKEG